MGLPSSYAVGPAEVSADAFYQKLDIVLTDEQGSKIPRELLCGFVASAHFGLIEWWLENDLIYSPSYMVKALNQLVKFGPVLGAKR